jgi:hypothetical protein
MWLRMIHPAALPAGFLRDVEAHLQSRYRDLSMP